MIPTSPSYLFPVALISCALVFGAVLVSEIDCLAGQSKQQDITAEPSVR